MAWRGCSTLRLLLIRACLLCPLAAEAGLYSSADQVVLLTPDTVASVLRNNSAALLVEFYASWCGHCVAFSPVWKALARDTREWKPAVDLVAIDCAFEENSRVCRDFGIAGYPSLKFFPAHSGSDSKGSDIKGFPRDVLGLRHLIIRKIEEHHDSWPPACPPLEAASKAEIDSTVQTNSMEYLALVFETEDSYVGREVTLDLLQFSNITVRRVLKSERELVSELEVTDFPSCYLRRRDSNFTRLHVLNEARTFYSYALQRLPGVVRSGKSKPVTSDLLQNGTQVQWRPFDRSGVYMSDLESALHYSLRVEVAARSVIAGPALDALRSYISVLAKNFPGRPMVKRKLQSLDAWMKSWEEGELPYSSLRAALDQSNQTAALPRGVRWVGCQGSRPHFRGYPCSVWTLFHLLTVQALETGSSGPLEVLWTMRRYMHNFFGCRYCSTHFEQMAEENMDSVSMLSEAVIWLWARHNQVNNRLAGDLSEDPHFPKIQWPPPDQCRECHGVKGGGEHAWNQAQVLAFLRSHYSAQHLNMTYLEKEVEVLEVLEQPQEHGKRSPGRNGRETPDPAPPEQEEEEVQKPALPRLRRSSIVSLRMRERPPDDIVDLDSFISEHYKAKAVHRAPLSGRIRQVDLQPGDLDPGRGARRWMTVLLGSGFSGLDVSLCVLFYLLSTMCLLGMYLCFKLRCRLRRTKVALP
ncbi:sulfhydryl oxidase 1-like isoform X1 [Denticeps clupeoides]|nr:sulfhydryl oxidase 1-like isoform X1 [Denticeps clupeoides]